MPRLNVPNRYRKGISSLLALDRSVFDEFVLALSRQAEVATRPLEVSDILIPGSDKADSQEILSAVLSLYRTWASAGDMTAQTFVEDVSKAVAVFDPAGDSTEGMGRLRKILDIEPLASSSKAFAVLTDNERDFHDVKILTDIRYAPTGPISQTVWRRYRAPVETDLSRRVRT